MAVHHTPVDALSCTVTMILFMYLYMNKGYNPRTGSAPNLPYHYWCKMDLIPSGEGDENGFVWIYRQSRVNTPFFD